MRALTQYGSMAEEHWRKFLPRMFTQLKANGQLDSMLGEAQEKTDEEMDQLRRQFQRQGLNPRQGLGDGSGEKHLSAVRSVVETEEDGHANAQPSIETTSIAEPESLPNQNNYRISESDRLGMTGLFDFLPSLGCKFGVGV
jgi:hypothetical protein